MIYNKNKAFEKLKEIVSKMEKDTSSNEESTKQYYINKILQLLNYPLDNKALVAYEETISDKIGNSKRIDYAIKRNPNEYFYILIEAKKISDTFNGLNHEVTEKNKFGKPIVTKNTPKYVTNYIDQAFDYAETKGIPWIILTNGKQLFLFATTLWGVEKYARWFLIINQPKDYIKKFEQLWELLENIII